MCHLGVKPQMAFLFLILRRKIKSKLSRAECPQYFTQKKSLQRNNVLLY